MILNILTLILSLSMTMTFFGNAINGIGMGLCVILSVVILFEKRQELVEFKSVMCAHETIAILVMFGVWAISAYHGIKPDKSFKEVFEYAGIILGGYIIFLAIQRNHFDFEKLFQYCVLGATVCSVWLSLTPFIGDWAIGWDNMYGSVLTLFIPMAFYLAQKRQVWWIAILIIVSGIFASGGRTGWVVLIGLVAIVPFFIPIQKRIINLIIFVAVVALGAFAGMQSYKHNIGEEAFAMRTEAMTNMDRPASGRLTVWNNTIDLIMKRPLLGYGIKSAQYLEISKGYDALVIHVHNVVLEMMLETGGLGFLAFAVTILIFIGGFLRAYFRSNDRALKQISMTVFLSCIAYGVCSMALTSMFHAWWFLYLVALVILLKAAELRLRQ